MTLEEAANTRDRILDFEIGLNLISSSRPIQEDPLLCTSTILERIFSSYSQKEEEEDGSCYEDIDEEDVDEDVDEEEEAGDASDEERLAEFREEIIELLEKWCHEDAILKASRTLVRESKSWVSMETPSSISMLTRSQTSVASQKSKNEDSFSRSRANGNHERSAHLDITNNFPIVGLATEKTPSSLAVKNRVQQVKNTPGSGEALLRGQVKTLLQKLEEEAEFVSNKAPPLMLQKLDCNTLVRARA